MNLCRREATEKVRACLPPDAVLVGQNIQAHHIML